MGEAKQIISFDEEKKLKLNKAELENILNREHVKELPIVILSVVGAFRTGKSFLLSWLVCYFKAHLKTSDWLERYQKEESASLSQFFKWRSGTKKETEGIWAWSEVFIVNGPAGGKVGVLLIDTQGLFDDDNTTKQNGNIFTLSTLISNIQIFNVSQRIQEDSLANLQLFSEFGRLATAKHNSNCSSANATKPFQRVVFLIRDWRNAREYPYGCEGGKDFIKNYLTEREGKGELRDRRKQIRNLYEKVDCYLMPYPGGKVVNDDPDFKCQSSDMDQIFKDHLAKLPLFLFADGEVQPKLVAGSTILAGDLANYVEIYVDLLNSDETLSAQPMFQAMAKIVNNTVARNAIEEYNKAYVAAIEQKPFETFLTDEEIQTKHLDAQKKAFEYFFKHKMEDDESSSAILLNKLKADIKNEFENWKSRNDLANEALLKDSEKKYSTSMNDWLKQAIPYDSFEQATEHHREVQKTVETYLKNSLKGPTEFTMPFFYRFLEFTDIYFYDVVIPTNERNEREEMTRLELSLSQTCDAASKQISRKHLNIRKEIINDLKQMKDESLKWKDRKELAKTDILTTNEEALIRAENKYIFSMNEWIKGEKFFANPGKLTKHQEDVQENVTGYLKSQLRGPDQISTYFMIRLPLFMQDYFQREIFPTNEAKRIASIGFGVAGGVVVAVGVGALAVVAAPVALAAGAAAGVAALSSTGIAAGAAAGVAALSSTGIAAGVKLFENRDPEEQSPPKQ